MATANATRTYPTQVIPSDPTDTNFESDFRSNTESLMTAVKDVDDEISVARQSSTTAYASLDASLVALDASIGGSTTEFWAVDSDATGVAGNTFLTVTGDKTTTYVADRAIRIVTSSGTSYAYVLSSSFSSNTQVNLADNSGSAFTFPSGTLTSISHAGQPYEALWLVKFDRLNAGALTSIDTRVATNHYTKTEIDTNHYTKTEIDTNHYTKTASDARYYTQTQVDTNHYTKTQSDARYQTVSPVVMAIALG